MSYLLYCDDCSKVMHGLGTGQVDAVITDPPYLDGDFSYLLPEFERIGKRVVLTPGKLESFNWIQKKKPFWEYCWRMSTLSLGGSACLHIGWEPVLAYHPPIKPLGNDVLSFTQKIFTASNGVHDWPKPLALFKFLVARWTNAGDWVIDPMMGSGTTGLACLELGRNFIGVEKDPARFAVAKQRIDTCALQGILPLDL